MATVAEDSERGHSLKHTDTITPSAPKEPVKSRGRS